MQQILTIKELEPAAVQLVIKFIRLCNWII